MGQGVECSMQLALCSLHHVVCGVQGEVCDVWCTACRTQCAVNRLACVICGVQRAVCTGTNVASPTNKDGILDCPKQFQLTGFTKDSPK